MTTPEHDDLAQVKKDVGTLLAFKNKALGALSLIGLLVTGIGYLLVTHTAKLDEVNSAQIAMQLEWRVFQQRVEPFLLQGPHFSSEDYAMRIQNDKSEIKEWVRNSYPPEWLRDTVEAHSNRLQSIEEAHRRLKDDLHNLDSKLSEIGKPAAAQ